MAGFLSLFMIARNDKVGFGLLHSVRIEGLRSPKLFEETKKYKTSISSKKIQQTHFDYNNNQDPLVLLQKFIDELSWRHKEVMDWTTLDSFHKLSDRVTQLVELNANDE